MSSPVMTFSAEQIHRYPFHFSRDLRLFLVLSGEIQINNVSGSVRLKSGDLEFVSMGEPAEILAVSKENTTLILKLDHDCLLRIDPNAGRMILNVGAAEFFPSDERNKTPQNLHNTRHLREMFLDLFEEYTRAVAVDPRNVEAFCRFSIDSFDDIRKLMYSFPQAGASMVKRFQRIDQYLQQHFSEKIRLDYLVESEGLSPQYLSAEIKNKYQRTFSSVLEYYRITAAVRRLLSGDAKIAEVAAACGFSDDKYFYRAWRSHLGDTPSAFRKKLAENPTVITHYLDIRSPQVQTLLADLSGKEQVFGDPPAAAAETAIQKKSTFIHHEYLQLSGKKQETFLPDAEEAWFYHHGPPILLSVQEADGLHREHLLGPAVSTCGAPLFCTGGGARITTMPGLEQEDTRISRVRPRPFPGENRDEREKR